jgi:hypothetical protein
VSHWCPALNSLLREVGEGDQDSGYGWLKCQDTSLSKLKVLSSNPSTAKKPNQTKTKKTLRIRCRHCAHLFSTSVLPSVYHTILIPSAIPRKDGEKRRQKPKPTHCWGFQVETSRQPHLNLSGQVFFFNVWGGVGF